jgi:hypothetical protein
MMNAEQLERAISVVIMLFAVIYFRSKIRENPLQKFVGIPARQFILLLYVGLAIFSVLLVVSFVK